MRPLPPLVAKLPSIFCAMVVFYAEDGCLKQATKVRLFERPLRLLSIVGKACGETVGKLWGFCGEVVGRVWGGCGESVGRLWLWGKCGEAGRLWVKKLNGFQKRGWRAPANTQASQPPHLAAVCSHTRLKCDTESGILRFWRARPPVVRLATPLASRFRRSYS